MAGASTDGWQTSDSEDDWFLTQDDPRPEMGGLVGGRLACVLACSTDVHTLTDDWWRGKISGERMVKRCELCAISKRELQTPEKDIVSLCISAKSCMWEVFSSNHISPTFRVEKSALQICELNAGAKDDERSVHTKGGNWRRAAPTQSGLAHDPSRRPRIRMWTLFPGNPSSPYFIHPYLLMIHAGNDFDKSNRGQPPLLPIEVIHRPANKKKIL